MITLKRFLVPTDYSEESRRALLMALELAEVFAASIELLHVWPAPYFASGYGYQFANTLHPAERTSIFDRIRADASTEMQAFVASVAAPAGVTVATRIESGDAPHVILEVIEDDKPDLVIVGTHGRSGARRWLMGSVAERLVQHSQSPVLTVP